MFPSRSKVQHLLGANYTLGPHPLVKSQRFTLIHVKKFPKVQCTDSMGLIEVHASWPEHPRLKKKVKKEEKFMMEFLLNNKRVFFFFNAIFKRVLIYFTISYISE
jgi:hypothetical protein